MAVGDFSRALFFTSYKLNINSTPPTPPIDLLRIQSRDHELLSLLWGVSLLLFLAPAYLTHRIEKKKQIKIY